MHLKELKGQEFIHNEKLKAIALFSGGLDSILAVKIIEKQGVEVVPVHFIHPFLQSNEYKKVKESLKINILEVDITDDFIEIIKHPKFGYGKNLNPCMDCKILYLKKAKEILEKMKADFIVTGDVVGQRPFSQRKEALNTIEKEAGVEGLIIRPLTQKNLKEHRLEDARILKRELFYSIKGRGRKVQIELAKEMNIPFIPSPAGGCLLTTKEFSIKTKDLLEKGLLEKKSIELLKMGRYFSLSKKASFVISRNEEESKLIENLSGFTLIKPIGGKGPSGVIIGEIEEFSLPLKILNYYHKVKPDYYLIHKEKEMLKVKITDEIPEEALKNFRVF